MASRIAIGQLCATANLTRNLGVVTGLISRALDNDVRLIFFPEATDYISQNAAHSRKLAEETPKFISRLQQEIKSLMSKSTKKIDVSIGVHLPSTGLELQKGDDRVKNVLLYIDHRGEILHTYQKMHLFDVDVPHGPILKESRSVQPGKTIPDIIDTPVGKLGTEICYDVRFPELSLHLREKGAQILCFPSAFTVKTGEAHWELLARARAIDTQCFVVMPAQQGKHDVSDPNWPVDESKKHVQRISWGHSMVVDPWGTIIAHSDINNKSDDPELIKKYAFMGSTRT
ncbi:carbon-nitrogen hydrolase [Zygosaccharomyces mellis]|uniref:Carbon-nitrogen hydrolase n=1 Tax=Zygosaccharomyces mellis TaxID=42258 RepID=A0A4C2E031_9SACH|nr:carbon-nitrogen hydrolase [Zygosaccharomyces mellis]